MANIDAKSLIPKTKVEHYAKLTERQDLKAFLTPFMIIRILRR